MSKKMKCHYCGQETDEYEILAGKKACFSCIIAAEESMGVSRDELYGHEKTMDCPYCGTSMEQGFVNIHGTLLGLLVAGISWLNCYFKPLRKQKDRRILGRLQKKAAFACPECEAVIIRGQIKG